MGKLKKFRAEFKEQNLLSKIRIILVSLLTFIIVFLVGFTIVYFICFWGRGIVRHHKVIMTQPVSSTYSLQTYKDGSLQLVVTETKQKIGSRFSYIRDNDILSDSVAFLSSEEGWKTFSLRTGVFSEEYYDYIEEPDTLHHYAACSRKGLLGFIDVNSGKLVIPLKFCAREDYPRDMDFYDRIRPLIADRECCVEAVEETCVSEEPVSESEPGYPEYEYPTFLTKDSKDNVIQFVGNYCIVPTTISTHGVIDLSGNLLFDGYETITYYVDCNLFKACKNKKYDLFSGNGQRMLSQQKRIPVLPQGIIHPQKGILTNHACTETLTNLVMRNNVSQLDEYGYKEFYPTYSENVYTFSSVNDFNGEDNGWYYGGTKFGIKDVKTGRTVIEPVWDDVDIYTNGKGKYIFKCEEGRYAFLMDENGKFLSRKNMK